MDETIIKALNYIPAGKCSYKEWLSIGMALKESGYPCSVWDEWSKTDCKRYHEGECDQKWDTFNGSSKPVTSGTIFHIANKYGWSKDADTPLDWDVEIRSSGNRGNYEMSHEDMLILIDNAKTIPAVDQIKEYLSVNFSPEEVVEYVLKFKQGKDGKWRPLKGDQTQIADLISRLNKFPDDIGAAFNEDPGPGGALICINPMDGSGKRKDNNVTHYNHTLIEIDTLPLEEQYELLHKLNLPITSLVYSGDKSLHAIVKIDATNKKEYEERISVLYKYLDNNRVPVDTSNKNPARLSRLPGFSRGGKDDQTLLETNIGYGSFEEWYQPISKDITLSDTKKKVNAVTADKVSSKATLPDIEILSKYKGILPELNPELIEGVLRTGHKMLISGDSKAGKSFLAMELAIAVSTGGEWLGFSCRQGSVLYVNFEIDPNSCINRFFEIAEAKELSDDWLNNINIWNLRGYARPLNEILPDMLAKMQGKNYDLIILDPMYKFTTGDENNASDMSKLCNLFDIIAKTLDASVLYIHHHTKGAQGAKRAIDRPSGSGVFARDADAIIDMSRLDVPSELAYRVEFTLREFPNCDPINIYFHYPIHELDENGNLVSAHIEGSSQANLNKSSRKSGKEERIKDFIEIFDEMYNGKPLKIKDIAETMNLTMPTIRSYAKALDDKFWIEEGLIGKK